MEEDGLHGAAYILAKKPDDFRHNFFSDLSLSGVRHFVKVANGNCRWSSYF